MQLWALIVDSFRESLDHKIFWVMLVITLTVVLAMLCVGFEGDRVSICFGAFEIDTDVFDPGSQLGRDRISSLMIFGIVDSLLGRLGVILMIIATSGIFPAMMRKGQIDFMLSKPLSRPVLFLYKYIASMMFVFLQVTIFVLLTFLVMGIHWGVWLPGYLVCIPLMVLLFSYIYCVSVFVAVKTRSTVAAILISIGAWFVFLCPQIVLATSMQIGDQEQNEKLIRVVRMANWIPPKTWDIPRLAAHWSGAGSMDDLIPILDIGFASDDDREHLQQVMSTEKQLEVSPAASIGSSLLFEAIVLAAAMWHFHRKDF